ncbi:tumor necrosis factor receptor superfamily member 6B-like [Sebastes umbrosus]|uniref:tumor necrosis factor receptor superfamily member 6B-like n=1 Tax=Sebastes umbrosus TaxID=72105 RepID=UPI00189D027B|nr:tumor necrosis factor receptor superfamily member 6B-like [Sebastes umbrosus]
MMSASVFPSLLLLLLLLQRRSSLLVDGVAAPLTFRHTDPQTGNSLECDRCAPGTYLRSSCTATRRSECLPCQSGSFTELWNYIGKCLRCGSCGQYQVVKKECSADSDCQCECRQGYYSNSYDICRRHSECQTGQGVLSKGTADEDTVCHSCPNGTYSNTVSALKNCTQHKSCDAPGLKLVLKGSAWHDSVCTSCQELVLRDGGDYLKEIIPSFLVHQKMTVRRLRQITHKLPSEDGRKQSASGLSLSDLLARINTWVTSATANQIRQLPAILIKTGANSAGERLLNKLQRIDLNLNGLCDSLGNEVDVIVMSG